METMTKIITAVHYKYEGGTARVSTTNLYFDDGTKLAFDGHWVFMVGQTYRIDYIDGNPIEIESVRIASML